MCILWEWQSDNDQMFVSHMRKETCFQSLLVHLPEEAKQFCKVAILYLSLFLLKVSHQKSASCSETALGFYYEDKDFSKLIH